MKFDLNGGTAELVKIDATGNNEGSPYISAGTATILVNTAGTGPNGEVQNRPNPAFDTRVGTVAAFAGNSGTLKGVYRIQDVQFEIWEDSIDPGSSSADVLGSLQFLGTFRGWLVLRDPVSGQFPALTGEGLGSTLWPMVDTSQTGQVYNTANGLGGGTATISDGTSTDKYATAGNGGLALSNFGGDLGAYLDAVAAPRVPAGSARFVYLESAGFGISNSFDPVFQDSISYDVVIVAAQESCNACDVNCDGSVNGFDIEPFRELLMGAGTPCSPCAGDTNGDGSINGFDIEGFVQCLSH